MPINQISQLGTRFQLLLKLNKFKEENKLSGALESSVEN